MIIYPDSRSQRIENSACSNEINSTLPGLLRNLGTILLLASAAVFVIQGWTDENPVFRFGSFSSLLFGLLLAGIFTGNRCGDDKGARAYVSIALLSFPALTAQISAMWHAFQQREVGTLPEAFIFTAPELGTLIAISATGALLIGLGSYICFRVMARTHALALTKAFVFCQAAVALPVRDATIVSILLIGMGILVVLSNRSLAQKIPNQSHFIVITAFLFTLGFCVIRTGAYYPTDSSFIIVSAAIYTTILFTFGSLIANERIGSIIQGLSLGGIPIAYFSTVDWLIGQPSFTGAMIAVWLPTAVTIIALSFRSKGSGHFYRFLAVAIANLAAIIELAEHPSLMLSAISIGISIGTLVLAWQLKERSALYAAILSLIVALGYHLRYASEFYALSGWASLALFGTLALMLSTVFERYRSPVSHYAELLRERLEAST